MTQSKLKVCFKCGVILHARGMGYHRKKCKGGGASVTLHPRAYTSGHIPEALNIG